MSRSGSGLNKLGRGFTLFLPSLLALGLASAHWLWPTGIIELPLCSVTLCPLWALASATVTLLACYAAVMRWA